MRKGPETIIWLITGRCNLNCKHCYAYPYRFENELRTDEVIKVLREAADVGVEYIQYTGGDPLLRKDIMDILKYTLDLGIETSVFTNATLVNNEVASKLSRLDVEVFTSIDGYDKRTYELIRGLGTWDKFVEGVKKLVDSGVYVHMNITICELNWRFIDRVILKALELGASSISLIPAMPSGNALRFKTYVTSEHFEEAVKKAIDLVEEIGLFSISIWCAPFVGIISGSKYVHYGNCRDWDVMDISPSGRVLLCDVLNKEVCNVMDVGVARAWEILNQNTVIRRIKNPKLRPPCSNCSFSTYCRGGCFARAYIMFNDYEAPDPLCPRVRSFMRVSKDMRRVGL